MDITWAKWGAFNVAFNQGTVIILKHKMIYEYPLLEFSRDHQVQPSRAKTGNNLVMNGIIREKHVS